MSIPLQELFEELNKRIGKPDEYNHLLSGIMQEFDDRLNAGASFQWLDGVPYIFDPTRLKMISMSRGNQAFSRYGASLANCYLKVGDTTTSGDQGMLMPRNGTLTSLVVKSRSLNNYIVEVRKNNLSTPIASITVTSGQGISDNLNVDFNQFDNIQLFIQGIAVDHPIANLEWAWRF